MNWNWKYEIGNLAHISAYLIFEYILHLIFIVIHLIQENISEYLPLSLSLSLCSNQQLQNKTLQMIKTIKIHTVNSNYTTSDDNQKVWSKAFGQKIWAIYFTTWIPTQEDLKNYQ